jgi:hypothetical protein
MDLLTLITSKYDGEDAARPRFMAPLVRNLCNAFSGLPGVASPNASELSSVSDEQRYEPKDHIIKIADSQHLLIISISIKVTYLGCGGHAVA